MKIKELIVYKAYCTINSIHSLVDAGDTFTKLPVHVRSMIASRKIPAHKISHSKRKFS